MWVLPLSLVGLLVFLAFLGGVFFASLVSVSIFVVWFLSATGVVFLVLSSSHRRAIITVGLCLLVFAGGILRMTWVESSRLDLEAVLGTARSFQGEIVELPDINGAVTRYVIKTKDLGSEEITILITTRRFPEFHRGEWVITTGKLEALPEADFPDYAMSLKRRGIQAVSPFPKMALVDPQPPSFLRKLDAVKNRFEISIRNALPEPDAGFVLGVILGERQSLGDDLRTALQRTGTTHIVALSGFNITIIALAVGWLIGFLHLSPRIRMVVSIIVIILFVILVGGGASIVRAAVMGFLVLLSRERGRVYQMTNALFFAAAVMVALNPYLLRFDLSFQLSFLATLGIILAPPRLELFASWIPAAFGIREIIVGTLSAEIFVLPLILWQFGMFSFVGPLVNLLILPVIPWLMLVGAIVGGIGLISLPLSALAGYAAHIMVAYVLGSIYWFSGWNVAAAALPQILALVFSLPALGIILLASRAYLKRIVGVVPALS
ncbi:MAG: hypothetical protein A3H71_00505 [Candidatus Sungbacteria bacterium RIFCSPLOWO2_02_FULL_48_13b]|uniref:ComEC/Rec2-related protein domain-containing protein n=2 Tax=Candidatus Sungiibacteriota TaxID=1817917 RepID=A0A1G2LGV7_9BACT|nr:MAG: hypothetical protein A3C12_02970 [Candidatus Sungbacteria bacterium RIFCSPHIGHO2_02_FULL_49_20]OHA10021.1 MAG: hypothetical protein A3H71_00505 [Candidatus Sungbacteria bacterium RIFCSPLOWO2_02_FULL_48_13b]